MAFELPARSYSEYTTIQRFRGFLQFGARPKLGSHGRECAGTVGQTFLLVTSGSCATTGGVVHVERIGLDQPLAPIV